MKRVQIHLEVDQGMGLEALAVPGRLILNDLGPLSVTLFTTQPMELGQRVTLAIDQPGQIQVRGQVTYCVLLELTRRVHAETRYPYRIQLQFEFLNDGDAETVRHFVEQMKRTQLTTRAA